MTTAPVKETLVGLGRLVREKEGINRVRWCPHPEYTYVVSSETTLDLRACVWNGIHQLLWRYRTMLAKKEKETFYGLFFIVSVFPQLVVI